MYIGSDPWAYACLTYVCLLRFIAVAITARGDAIEHLDKRGPGKWVAIKNLF